MKASILMNYQRAIFQHHWLCEYEKHITGVLMAILLVSMLVLVGVKFENYRLMQQLSQVESQNQGLMLEMKKLTVDQEKMLSYLSVKNYSATNKWQNGSALA